MASSLPLGSIGNHFYGGGALLEQFRLPTALAKTLMAVLIISFAATTLDTATRIQRFIISEIGTAIKFPPFQNKYIATVCTLVPAITLTMWSIPYEDGMKETAWVLWPIFGASNQMLAALTLLIICLYFLVERKPILPMLIPFGFITVITLLTLFLKAGSFFQNNMMLFVVDIVLIGLILRMLAEGIIAYRKQRTGLQTE